MPSNETKIVVPFPPTEDEAEKAQREKLRKRYEEMHDALDRAEFTSTEELLAYFNVGTDKEYLDILKAGFARPCMLHRWTPEQKFVIPMDRKGARFQHGFAGHTRPLCLCYLRGRLRQQIGSRNLKLQQSDTANDPRKSRRGLCRGDAHAGGYHAQGGRDVVVGGGLVSAQARNVGKKSGC